jgi:hypothetical protein
MEKSKNKRDNRNKPANYDTETDDETLQEGQEIET